MTNPYQAPSGGAAEPRATIDPQTASDIEVRISYLNRRSLGLGVVALCMQFYGRARGDLIGMVILVAGLALLVYALSLYAAMRGQSRLWGFAGLLSCLGLVILALLPKRCHNCGATTKSARCDQCGAPAPK